jgi:hypothetical protein
LKAKKIKFKRYFSALLLKFSMKKLSLIAISALFCLNANAQITIDQSDLPSPADVITRHNAANFTALDFVTTGPNFTWDFSTLDVTDSINANYFNITQAPFTSLFTFGPFGPNTTKSQLFKDGANPLNTGAIPGGGFLFAVDSSFEFYKKSATRFAKTGYSINLNGFAIPLPFDSNDVVYKLPMNYGNVDSSHSIFEINSPFLSFLYYNGDQRRINTVDGWGKLKLPNVAVPYDVLRIKSEIFSVDTIHIDTLIINTGFKIARPKSTEYKWIAKGLKAPILVATATELLGTETITGVNYKFTPKVIPQSIRAENQDDNVSIYPTKINESFRLIGEQGTKYNVEIITIDGKLMQSFKNVNANTNISPSINSGLFLVKITSPNGLQKVIKISK